MTADTKSRKTRPAPRRGTAQCAASIRVTSTGEPPLSAAAAFARLMAACVNR